MKKFNLRTGEVAYVPTESEKEIIELALRQFQASLSRTGESA